MKASECIDGQLYDLPCSKYSEAYKSAVCQGPNYNNKWMLFLTIDQDGKRIIRTIMFDTEVIPTVTK